MKPRALLRRLFIGASTLVLLNPTLAAAAQGEDSRDPSPYCRPVVNKPLPTSPKSFGNDTWGFTASVQASLSCNGPIYAGSITAVLHYSTSPAAIGAAASGAQAGSGTSCGGGSCTDTAYYSRTLECHRVYEFDDHGQVTGFWQRTSSSPRETISILGEHSTGNAYNGVVECLR
ncbi:hypothetical protein [Kitasatospora sp. NPDC058190]|uniref:hypothetical protein n=1 Tax=Kitasatospora sp. NPDC058190 TaxID=3346371 RepID=UPI0036D7ADA4